MLLIADQHHSVKWSLSCDQMLMEEALRDTDVRAGAQPLKTCTGRGTTEHEWIAHAFITHTTEESLYLSVVKYRFANQKMPFKLKHQWKVKRKITLVENKERLRWRNNYNLQYVLLLGWLYYSGSEGGIHFLNKVNKIPNAVYLILQLCLLTCITKYYKLAKN